jgi:hypothetical protein
VPDCRAWRPRLPKSSAQAGGAVLPCGHVRYDSVGQEATVSDPSPVEIEHLRQRLDWADQSILALADALKKLAEATLDAGPLSPDLFTSNEIAETLHHIRQTRPSEG